MLKSIIRSLPPLLGNKDGPPALPYLTLPVHLSIHPLYRIHIILGICKSSSIHPLLPIPPLPTRQNTSITSMSLTFFFFFFGYVFILF